MTKAERNTAAHQAELAIDPLRTQLAALHLSYVLQQYEALATEAAAQHWSHVDYLEIKSNVVFGKFVLIRRQAVAEPVCCRSPVVRL